MDIISFCSLSGICYDLSTQFLLRVPWQDVLKNATQAGSKHVWASRSAYSLVLKDVEMAQQIYLYFSNTISKIDANQQFLGVSICSLDAAKEFLVDFRTVLDTYKPENVSSWKQNVAGESLRQQLQYYISFAHGVMSNVSLELQQVNLLLQSIQIENNTARKEHLLEMLRTSCENKYGMLFNLPAVQPEDIPVTRKLSNAISDNEESRMPGAFEVDSGYGSGIESNNDSGYGSDDDDDIFSDATD